MPATTSGRPPRRGDRRTRWLAALIAMLIGAVLLMPVRSYAAALTAPGAATWDVRTVDWLRQHGAASVINAVENWYYSRRAPADRPPDPTTLPQTSAAASSPPAKGPRPRPLPIAAGRAPLPGEARWLPGRVDRGVPLSYTGFFRPDPVHASVVAGVAWFRQPGTVAHLVAGTVQPGGPGWPGNAAVPVSDVPGLVATFNSGWRMQDLPGGFFLYGRPGPALVDGLATAAIDDRGQLTVGQWGRDLSMNPRLVAARQNLQLIVDHGRPVPDLRTNGQGQWGSPKNQFQFTPRSALGVDAEGNLVYVAGADLSLETLATALADAGAVRGMELDIHRGMTFLATWQPGPGGPRPIKLLPTMSRSPYRYLVPDQRDFFYLTATTPTAAARH